MSKIFPAYIFGISLLNDLILIDDLEDVRTSRRSLGPWELQPSDVFFRLLRETVRLDR